MKFINKILNEETKGLNLNWKGANDKLIFSINDVKVILEKYEKDVIKLIKEIESKYEKGDCDCVDLFIEELKARIEKTDKSVLKSKKGWGKSYGYK